MLVLTRRTEQRIQIGPHITVTVLRVKGGAVRIGIEAPADVKILRSELSESPPSLRQPEAAGIPADRSAAAASVSGLPGQSIGREATEAGDEGGTSTDPLPGTRDPRRPGPRRSPAPPGLSRCHRRGKLPACPGGTRGQAGSLPYDRGLPAVLRESRKTVSC